MNEVDVVTHNNSIIIGSGGASTEANEIVLCASPECALQNKIIVLKGDGRIIVNGKLIEDDKDLVDAFRIFLQAVSMPKPVDAVYEGKMMPFNENHGWYLQLKPNPRENDNGVRNAGTMFTDFIGKHVRVTIEVIK